MISRIVRKSPLFAALLFLACGKEPNGPSPVATTVSVSDGTVQTATVGTVVTPALTFSVKDQNGSAMGGVSLTITVTGGGTLTSPPTTSSAGATSIGVWTLGTIVGVNTVTIKAGSLAPITFSITTVAGAATQIVAASGGGQSAPAGSMLSPITLKVADQFGNGIAGRAVSVAVIDGGGFVSPASGTTDAAGQFTGINWTLGKSALPQTLSLQSISLAGTVSATVATSYALEVRYFGGDPAPSVRTAFDNAAARIRGAITGTLGLVPFTNVDLNAGNTNCGVPVVLNEQVRDVLIFAQIHPIDGVGKILGSAGPCLVRSVSRLTIIGVMNFDSDDLNNLAVSGRLESVILHEMLHVVGVGTLWDEKTPSLITGAGTGEPRFAGSATATACSTAGGTTLCSGGVAVENCVGIPTCGAGTRDSHWREGTTTIPGFNAELMTGFVEGTGVFMPYSDMTIQSLGDLGYTINSLAADAYSVPGPSLRALLQLDSSGDPSQWERIHKPKAAVSPSGSVQPITRQ